MTVLHPMSSMAVARLAAALLGDGTWAHISRVEAREIVARMEKGAEFGPAVGSQGAMILDVHARRLSALATAAYEAGELAQDRDLSWLWDPEQIDSIRRTEFVY